MASAKLFDMTGAELGSVDLNPGIFEAEIKPALVHEVAVALRAAQRQGNAETKTRKEVAGGGAKPYRQKGTGRARRGSIREPHMRGGGTVFGPHKRSYRQNVPRSAKKKALCCILSDRVREGNLCVLDRLAMDTPKTKTFHDMMTKLHLTDARTLVVTAAPEPNVLLSARNIPRVSVVTAADLNALDALGAARIVLAQDALPKLEERLA